MHFGRGVGGTQDIHPVELEVLLPGSASDKTVQAFLKEAHRRSLRATDLKKTKEQKPPLGVQGIVARIAFDHCEEGPSKAARDRGGSSKGNHTVDLEA